LPIWEKIFALVYWVDVVRDGERTVGAGALGVHAPLGNHLTVEVGELLQEPDIL
jgi:hypothetical protein